MKIGEIRSCPDGTFVMGTRDGVRDVTLRCTDKGEVHVEEVSGGGRTVKPLRITQMSSESPAPASSLAQQVSSVQKHLRSKGNT